MAACKAEVELVAELTDPTAADLVEDEAPCGELGSRSPLSVTTATAALTRSAAFAVAYVN